MSRVRGRSNSIWKLSAMRAGPAVNTTTRVPRNTASLMPWVTKTMVLPDSFQMRSSSRFIFSRVSASSAPKGSSISTSLGSCTRARAMAARCCMPPESSYGNLSSWPARPTMAMSSRARARAGPMGRPSSSAGSSTLSRMRRHFSSSGAWNTMPMSRAGSKGWVSEPRRTVPHTWGCRPARIFSKVLLPQPEGPTSATSSPGSTSKVASLMASVLRWALP